MIQWRPFGRAFLSTRLFGPVLRPNPFQFHYKPSRNLATSTATGLPPALVNEGVKLRQYQEECIQSVLAHINNGEKRLAISLATGGGKTVVFTQLIDRIPPKNSSANRTLIIVHRRELLEQAARHCEQAYPHKKIEVEMANSHASGMADITVASIQTLVKPDRLRKFRPDEFKLVLVDEVHHIVAGSYLRVLEHFRLKLPPGELSSQIKSRKEQFKDAPTLVGVTATASRFDGLSLGAALDQIVYHKDFLDMIEEKWLSPVKFTTVKTFAKLDEVKINQTGDFSTAPLSKAVRTTECNDITVRTWMKEAKGRTSTLVFCVDIAHVEALKAAFRDIGIDARAVTSKTTIYERSHVLDIFRNGKFPVLLNCGVFTEGTDIPNVDCVLLARPTRSRNLLIQMIGRGLRLSPSKTDCLVIDMVSAASVGVITTPSLFGLDPDVLVKHESIESLREMKTRLSAESMERKEADNMDRFDEIMQSTKYQSVYDLIDDTRNERHIRVLSNNAWVAVGPEQFVLGGRDSGKLSVAFDAVMAAKFPAHVQKESRQLERRQPDNVSLDAQASEVFRGEVLGPKLWKVYYRRPMKEVDTESKIPFTRPSLVAKARTFEDAVHAADTYADDVFPRFSINLYAPWRKGPASEAQLSFLNKMRSADDQLAPHDITKGKATDMISKIKNGVKGRFDKAMARKQREEKVTSRREELLKRDLVSVGPFNPDVRASVREAHPS
ncbi:MAG: hypothetical protein Q9227_001567 [Pyrenula ochraceoflavens]